MKQVVACQRHDPGKCLDAARHAAIAGDWSHAAALARGFLARRDANAPDAIDAATLVHRLASWHAPEARQIPPPNDTAVVRIGVLSYRGLDYTRSSRNLGDYLQTVAMLSHLATMPGLAFVGDPGLVGHVGRLRRLGGHSTPSGPVTRIVELVAIDRDASVFNRIDNPVMTPLFGWLSIPMLDWWAFPMHPLVRPLPLSLHIQHPAMLTAPMIEWLRRYGPIGCRDMATLRLLSSVDVPAFFTGCLTTTLGRIIRQSPAPLERPGAIDYSPGARTPGPAWRRFTHAVPELPLLDPGDALDLALDRLLTYARLPAAATTRLHAYLPLRSMGVPVTLPDQAIDPSRFDGLAAIPDHALDAMAAALHNLFAGMLDAILAGLDEDGVSAMWRERTMPLVEAHAHLSPNGSSMA